MTVLGKGAATDALPGIGAYRLRVCASQTYAVKIGHRIADSRLAAWVCGKGAVIANLRYGAQAVVLANEYSGRAMYLWGDEDPRLTAIVTALLRQGDTVLDIGANFGVIGLLAAKCVGPEGKVHLFEPQPLVASFLRTSLFINGFSQAVLHECALSNRTGTAQMAISDPLILSTAALSAPRQDIAPEAQIISVRMEEAGTYIASLGCDSVALLKIDVEGHEPVILASMREWLEAVRPPIILFECHLDGRSFHQHETVSILAALGYEFLSVDTRPLVRTRLFPVDEEQRSYGRDFVAVRWNELDHDRRQALEAFLSLKP